MEIEVGFSRAVKREWLDEAALIATKELDIKKAEEELKQYLSFDISDKTILRKTKMILMRTWCIDNNRNAEVRKTAIEMWKANKADKLVIHWCLMLLAYPVFENVCRQIGNISKVQDDFQVNWLKNRLFEIMGEQTTLKYATEKIMQTLRQIEATEHSGKGKYKIKEYDIADNGSKKLIVMTLLALGEKSAYDAFEISNAAVMFPFKYNVTNEWLYTANIAKTEVVNGRFLIML